MRQDNGSTSVEEERSQFLQLNIMYIIGALRGLHAKPADLVCPVTAKMSFDSRHVVSHVVATAIMSSGYVGETQGLIPAADRCVNALNGR